MTQVKTPLNDLKRVLKYFSDYVLKNFVDKNKINYIKKFLYWLRLHFLFHFKTTKTTKFRKYEIYWIHFGVNIGTEFGEKRPGIIFKSNKFVRGKDIIVLPITSKKENKNYGDLDVFLEKSNINNLKQNSIVKIEHIKAISKMRIGDYIGRLDEKYIEILNSKIAKMLLK